MDGWDEGYNFKVGRYLRVYSATYMYLGARMYVQYNAYLLWKGDWEKAGGIRLQSPCRYNCLSA